MSIVLEGILEGVSDKLLDAYEDYSREDLLKEQWFLLENIKDEKVHAHIRALYEYMQVIVAFIYTERYDKQNIH